jgi:hypothetical protein
MDLPIAITGANELVGLGDPEPLFELASQVKRGLTGNTLNLYYTGDAFPAISVTGRSCALDCAHCGRHMLDGVHHAVRTKEIVAMAKGFEERGSLGVLLTGGCRPDGSVPLDGFLDAIEIIKEETSLFLLAHTGIIDAPTAEALRKAGLDGVSLDVVGNVETTRKVYGIDIPPERYRESLLAFQEAGFDVISPHVCVGLDYGRTGHELHALDIISSITPTTIEVIALMPLKGTKMEGHRPEPMDVAKTVAVAQLMFPQAPITLGCAHSTGTDRAIIEELALKAGASAIALPTPRTERLAEEMGYDINRVRTCCAVPPEFLGRSR